MGQAIFKQRNGLVAVNVVGACGVFSPEQFLGLAEAAKSTEVQAIKLTSRQSVVLLIGESKLPAFTEKISNLGLRISPYENSIRCVKACAGNTDLCPRAIANALNLGIELQEKYIGQTVPKDFKIAVTGCPRGCTDPYCADFGLVACGKDAYHVAIGGRGGSANPEHGVVIIEKVFADKIPAVLDHVLSQYRKLAQPGEKLCKTISRVGIQNFIPPFSQDGSTDERDEEFSHFLMSED